MRNKKNLLLLLPIFVFVASFMLMKFVDSSYAINSDTAQVSNVKDGTVYSMIAKNTYSYYLITGNYNHQNWMNTSGTKLLQSTANSNDKAVVYCATPGKSLSELVTRIRYSIDNSKVPLDSGKIEKLKKVMPYMYPYINLGEKYDTTGSLKELLYNSLDQNVYNEYKFDELNVNEAITAIQASIWNIVEGYTDLSREKTYQFSRLISGSFSAFDTCENYVSFKDKNNRVQEKILTTEEANWYQNGGGCSTSGNFYKFVYKHDNNINEVKRRVNKLIDWYVNTLAESTDSSTQEYFDVASTSFGATTLTVTFNTNITGDYTIEFKSGNEVLSSTKNGNTFEVQIGNNKEISYEVTSPNSNSNLFYYYAGNGQSFIGLERSNYTKKDTILRTGNAKIIIYKVANKDGNQNYNVNVEAKDGITDFDTAKCDGGCLSNSKFELYFAENSSSPKTLVKRFELNYEKLNTVMIDNLPFGTYYLKETQPPYGYDLYKKEVPPVDSDGFIVIDVNEDKTYEVQAYNTKTRICFIKVDADDQTKVLSGAEFEIRDVDGALLEQFESSNKRHCIDDLQAGSYFVQETKAPVGYSIDTTKYRFVVGSADSNISSLQDVAYKDATIRSDGTVVLKDKKGAVISKSDFTDASCVQGATLTVTYDNCGENPDGGCTLGEAFDTWISNCEDGNDSHTLPVCSDKTGPSYITDDNGNRINCLGVGDYYLTEEVTPGRYATAETIKFTIGSDGSISGDLNMRDKPITACFKKVDSNGKMISGAKFELYKEDDYGKENAVPVSDFTSTEKETCVPYIEVGNYILIEKEAPEGYKKLEDEIKIEIKNDGDKQYFSIENEVNAPKTSINSSKLVIIISTIFMVIGIGLVGYYGFKKHD